MVHIWIQLWTIMDHIWTVDGSVYGPYMDPAMVHNGILMEFYGPYMDRYGLAILHVHGWVEI